MWFYDESRITANNIKNKKELIIVYRMWQSIEGNTKSMFKLIEEETKIEWGKECSKNTIKIKIPNIIKQTTIE